MRDLRRLLLRWYRAHRRDLPWRQTNDPYRIWVSEVMLQQTTVKAVVPYYERFLTRFPTLDALAAADEDEVLALWSGLGYYRRARSLLAGARHVLARHAGSFPRSRDDALAVPGVGSYTAAAVLSIAYGEPWAVVDGNVRRVVARLFALDDRRETSDAALAKRAGALLSQRDPGTWNQALMELGATVCLPRDPSCPACPLQASCAARARGAPSDYPAQRARRLPVRVPVTAAVFENRGRFLLVRRHHGPLLARTWEVPQTDLDGAPSDVPGALREKYGLDCALGGAVGEVRHAITFRRIRVEVLRGRLLGPVPTNPGRFRWVRPADAEALPMSSMTRKILSLASCGEPGRAPRRTR